MGYGGPHAAYMAVKDALKRAMPGRIVGLSVDSRGAPAYRLAFADPRTAHPPREGDVEHLHRAGAARGHRLDVCRLSRPRGTDAHRTHRTPSHGRCWLWGLRKLGFTPMSEAFFDTVTVLAGREAKRHSRARTGGKDQPAHRRADTVHRARRDDHAGNHRGGVARVRRRTVLRGHRDGRARRAAAGSRARRQVPDPSGVPRTSLRDPNSCATCASCPTAISRSTAL